MSPPAIPKVAIAPEKWAASIYGTPESCLAKAEVGALPAMQFDPSHWSRAYTQCIGRGLSHSECAASIPDDVRITPSGPLATPAAAPYVANAVTCMSETGDMEKCDIHFKALQELAGYKEPVNKGTTEKAGEFCSKAGYKLLGLPVLLFGMRFIKIK
mmetsp:Transcript_11858/g.26427  ORF Transcript_11858/g.26427 Transcript_11858/m.26427 type:complete len:157 (-) Transcript_11858:92-562(-)